MWSYYVVRWYLGNTLAEYFGPTESTIDAANMAASMAPNDPSDALAHRSGLTENTAPGSTSRGDRRIRKGREPFRLTTIVSGCRWEQRRNSPAIRRKAELALKRAVALAPSYAYPRWYLGNLYLRNGRYDEAFAELRQAAEADPDLLPQLFNLVWEIYNSDPEALKKRSRGEPRIAGAISRST